MGPPDGLADALHLGGNGLVPQAAAEAIRQLLTRAGWRFEMTTVICPRCEEDVDELALYRLVDGRDFVWITPCCEAEVERYEQADG